MQVLDSEVVGWTDTGGRVGAPREPVAGRERVAKTFLAFLRSGVSVAPLTVNGEPGAVVYGDSAVVAVLAFEVRAGLITRIHGIASPQKLTHVPPALAPPASDSLL
jgi:hypothetical protein